MQLIRDVWCSTVHVTFALLIQCQGAKQLLASWLATTLCFVLADFLVGGQRELGLEVEGLGGGVMAADVDDEEEERSTVTRAW